MSDQTNTPVTAPVATAPTEPAPSAPTTPAIPAPPPTEPQVSHEEPAQPVQHVAHQAVVPQSNQSKPLQTRVQNARPTGFVNPSHVTAKGPMQTPPVPGASNRSLMDGGPPPPIVKTKTHVVGNVSTPVEVPHVMQPQAHSHAAPKKLVSRINPNYDPNAPPPSCIRPGGTRPVRATKSGLKRPAPTAQSASAKPNILPMQDRQTADGGKGAPAPAAAQAVTVGAGQAVAPKST